MSSGTNRGRQIFFKWLHSTLGLPQLGQKHSELRYNFLCTCLNFLNVSMDLYVQVKKNSLKYDLYATLISFWPCCTYSLNEFLFNWMISGPLIRLMWQLITGLSSIQLLQLYIYFSYAIHRAMQHWKWQQQHWGYNKPGP